MILYSATWKKEGEKDAVLYARVFSLEATSVVIRGEERRRRKGGAPDEYTTAAVGWGERERKMA